MNEPILERYGLYSSGMLGDTGGRWIDRKQLLTYIEWILDNDQIGLERVQSLKDRLNSIKPEQRQRIEESYNRMKSYEKSLDHYKVKLSELQK